MTILLYWLAFLGGAAAIAAAAFEAGRNAERERPTAAHDDSPSRSRHPSGRA